MEDTLLVYKCVNRATFEHEDYTADDDIFALVEHGSFVFDNGSGQQVVGPLEGVNFSKGIRYHRHILQEATIHLFRFRSGKEAFGDGTIVFEDRDRIRSTIYLLKRSDETIEPDSFYSKQILFSDILNQYRLENVTKLARESQQDELVAAAIEYIKGNLHHKLNLVQLASQHYLSYVQFSRRFKNATGSTPQDYIIGLRLKKAQSLLEGTDMPVNQVARLCGFSNAYYFSNFFRKHCSHSPAQYRELIKTTDVESAE